MTNYKKNNLRADMLSRFGQESGLPLFEATKPVLNKIQQARLDSMPKSVVTANDTKRLARTMQLAEEMHLADDQQKVFELLLNEGPMTNKEMGERLGMDASTISARNNELRALGLIVDAGRRQCRRTGFIVHQWGIR
jgi:predicted transcriptional regulator